MNNINKERIIKPWGYYENLVEEELFKVKKIFVAPFSALSLQVHSKRSEHWLVNYGIATVQKADEIVILHQGSSTFIKVGLIHRLINNQPFFLEMVEIQTGSSFDEDDIIRIEDIYGRA
jgi:mannose-6-phosphate isomerase-like protein (cupin superfamily)